MDAGRCMSGDQKSPWGPLGDTPGHVLPRSEIKNHVTVHRKFQELERQRRYTTHVKGPEQEGRWDRVAGGGYRLGEHRIRAALISLGSGGGLSFVFFCCCLFKSIRGYDRRIE